MSVINSYSSSVNFLPGQYNTVSQCFTNQDGMKLIVNQDNSLKYTSYCDKKIFVGDVALSEESPVTVTQLGCNTFKPATNEDEIAIDGQKTRKPRTVINERWTNEEDARLAKAVKEHGAKNWKNIAKIVGGSRTDVQCLHRWRKVISPELVKGPWTPEEDRVIIEEVEKVPSLANVKWSEIAQKLHGRIGKQCRERYLNYLDSSIKRGEWTEEEDRVLFEIQRVIGNRWCEIAKVLPGRSENNVKNRFNSKMRNVYITKYPNQMIPSSVIIEQQIEDPIHGNKKRRILCPAVKNLLKYLNLSKEFFDSLEEYSNMKHGNNNNNNKDNDIPLSIQPSGNSSGLLFSNNNNILNGNGSYQYNSDQLLPPSLNLPLEQQQIIASSLMNRPQKRRAGGNGGNIDNDNRKRTKKVEYYSFENSLYGSNINIEDEIFMNSNGSIANTTANNNKKQTRGNKSKNNKTSSSSSKVKVSKKYQLRKRRKNGKRSSKYDGDSEEEEESSSSSASEDDEVLEMKRVKRGGVNNNNNNVIDNVNSINNLTTSYSPTITTSTSSANTTAISNTSALSSSINGDSCNNSMILGGYVDEEEAYKNFVDTIPDNNLISSSTTTTTVTGTSAVNNINNNNNNGVNTNDNSMTRFYNSIHNSNYNYSTNTNSNCIISNNFSDPLEDELNPSCLDCFE